MVFEFSTINSENLSPTKQTKFLNSFLKSKPIKFSNFINHIMVYHEFRFISYIDESFSIEKKLNNTKQQHYTPITIQNMPASENKRELDKHRNFLNFLTNVSKEFVNFALERDHRLNMLFKNAQISELKYTVTIDSENSGTYFISLDKNYLIRFCAPKFFVYHIPTGKGYSFSWISWGIFIDPRKKFEFQTFTEQGEFLPSCIHPRIKQMIFENKIKHKHKHKQETQIQFRLNFQRGPKTPVHYSVCFANCLDID